MTGPVSGRASRGEGQKEKDVILQVSIGKMNRPKKVPIAWMYFSSQLCLLPKPIRSVRWFSKRALKKACFEEAFFF